MLNVRKKESCIWHTNKDFHLKNSKSSPSLKKCIKNGVSKACKSVRKVSKTQSGYEFK